MSMNNNNSPIVAVTDQVREAERSLGHTLRAAERFSTVFVAHKAGAGGKIQACRIAYVSTEETPSSVFVLALKADGVIEAVRAVGVPGDQRLTAESYLKQFSGKTVDNLQGVAAPLGAEAENARVLAAVRRTMKLIELALPSAK